MSLFSYDDLIHDIDILELRYENALLTAEEDYNLDNNYIKIYTESDSNGKSFANYIDKLIKSFKEFADKMMEKIKDIILKQKSGNIPDMKYVKYEDADKMIKEAEDINKKSKSLIRKILEKGDVDDRAVDAIVNQTATYIKFVPTYGEQVIVASKVYQSNENLYKRQHDLNRDLCAIGELSKRAQDKKIDEYNKDRIRRLHKASQDATKHSLEGIARRAMGLPAHQTKVYKTGDTYHWTNR